MYSHMCAYPYALNGIFLADAYDILGGALQFPVVKNKTFIEENENTYEKAHIRRHFIPRAYFTGK